MGGSNSGLFTPSRRALAGGAARKSAGEMDIPAMRPYSADRRETEDVGMMLMSSDDVDDIADDEISRDDASMGELGMVVMGANASAESTAWRRNAVHNASAMVDGGQRSEGSMGSSSSISSSLSLDTCPSCHVEVEERGTMTSKEVGGVVARFFGCVTHQKWREADKEYVFLSRQFRQYFATSSRHFR